MSDRKICNILFYPQQPSSCSTIYKIMQFLGYNITTNPQQPFDIAIYWEDTTFRKKCKISNTGNDIINKNCIDISKKKINQAFESIFKYSSLIEPIEFNGKCVKKSNLNATHDGCIIDCPIKLPETGFVYQKLINNQNKNYGIYDIRVPIIKQTIPFVLIKLKILAKRFEDNFIKSMIQETHAIFSDKEIINIIKFCNELGFDYGELDILRDYDDNKIYVIDANNTPWWDSSLLQNESDFAIARLANIFKKEFGTP